MGRTTPTVRQKMEEMVRKYSRMKGIMRAEDAEILDRILIMGRRHSPEVSMAGLDADIGFVLSVLIELMKSNTSRNRE